MIFKRAIAVLILALLAGCGVPPAARMPISETPDRYTGKRLWVASKWPLSVCSSPEIVDPKKTCFTQRTGSFTVDRRTYDTRLNMHTGYAITLADGRQGFVSSTDPIMQDDEETHKSHLAAKADCDRRGGVAVGMTRAQVYASCWGKPQKINTTTNAGGDHEQLVYPGYNYLYLRNGVVTSIQTSK